jgi:hypothetical protein
MIDAVPIEAMALPPVRDDRMRWTVLASVGVHLLVFLILLLPRLPVGEPKPPPAVNVDIVTSSELASLAPSSAASSIEPSSEASSSQPSEAPSSRPSEASSSAASSAPPSAAASSEAASSAPPPSHQAASEEAPKPFPAPRGVRTTIPVGPQDSSSETSSGAASGEESSEAASADASASGAPADSGASLLTAAGGGGGDATDAASSIEPAPPAMSVVGGGKLHAARRFYLKDMLASPLLSQAKGALKQLSPARRLAQTCNIEATGQAVGAGYQADAIIANAFAPPEATDTTYSVSGGVLRADGHWYRIAYQCTLNKDLSNVASFSFHIGDDVTQEITARLSGGQ